MKYRAILSLFHGRLGTQKKLYAPGDFYEPTDDELKNSAKIKEAQKMNKLELLPAEVIFGAVPPHFVKADEWTGEMVERSEFEARLRKIAIKPHKANDLSEDDMRLANIIRASMGQPPIDKNVVKAVG
jgi:hypothetical protein